MLSLNDAMVSLLKYFKTVSTIK